MRRTGLAVAVVGGLIAAAGSWTTAQDKESDLARQAAEFVYPGAEKRSVQDKGPMYSCVLITADEYSKVYDWYRSRLGTASIPDDGIISASSDGKYLGTSSNQNDSVRPAKKGDKDEPRPVQLRVLSEDTKAYTAMAVVSRGKDEKETHIVLTYVQKVGK